MDDVVRRASTTSVASSPDSNLLRVQAHLPGRRHSDNTIQPPRILIGPPSPTTSFSLSRGPSATNLNARRHSSINMQDAKNMLPKMKCPKIGNMSEIAKIPNNIAKDVSNNINSLGIESFLSSRSSGRRYSAVPTFDAINSIGSRKNSSSNFLQTLGTGVQQLFGK